MLNVQQIKADFPIFKNYPDLVYLDNAATSQKPKIVIDAISEYYQKYNANVHRGVHFLSDQATQIFTQSKLNIAHFFNAQSEELIFTRNCTEAINAVAYAWGEKNIQAGDIILTSIMEHHSNLVPWQELCRRKQAQLKFIKLNEDGNLNFNNFKFLISNFKTKIKLVALTHVSNVLGVVNNLQQIVSTIHHQSPASPAGRSTIRILVDGAQAVAHLPIDFQKLNVDFYAFSGHKMLGPMGIGGLLVKKSLLESGEFSPWLFGGGMIDTVTTQNTKFNSDLNDRFVAGTPDVASVYGLSKACEYLQNLNLENIKQHSQNLSNYAVEKLSKLKNIKIIGLPHLSGSQASPDFLSTSGEDKSCRLALVAFTHQKIHAHDLAQVLDSENVAVRSGHHCCMPLHQKLKIPASLRASFSVYNDQTDIDKLIMALGKAEKILL